MRAPSRRRGRAPLAPELARINGVKTKADLIKQVAYMHQNGLPALFAFYPQPDMHDSNATIAYIDQGGITLPDRDYYIKDDAKSVGDPAEISGARAEDV